MAKKRKKGGGPRKHGGKAGPRAQPAPAKDDKPTAATGTASPAKDDKANRAAEPASADQPSRRDDKRSSKSDDQPKSRGAQRRQEAKAKRVASPPSSLPPAADPTFWFGFEITWAKLVLARVIVFAVLALDALEQIKHAPRYGAGGFNVAHISWLDALGPTRASYSICQLLLAFCFVFAACGVATRVVLPAATAIYGWLYFGSQLDSYQHHYLVWLFLVLACWVPWSRPADAVPVTRVRTWAVRLIVIQLALLYFWAAVSKMNSAWLDGRTLSGQLDGIVRSVVDSTIGIKAASWLVLIVELVLAATIWFRRGWVVAAPLGIALHVGIMNTSLEIGRFAELMLALYIFVVPDRVWTWLAELPPFSIVRDFSNVMRRQFDGVAQWLLLIIAVGTSAVLVLFSHFHHAVPAGFALLAAVVVGGVIWRKRVSIEGLALACVLAFGTWTAVDRLTMTASDYFRLWGGSSRRLGDPETAEFAYRKMIEVAPDEGGGYYQLGKLLLQRNADEEGIALLHQAQDREPLKARAYIAEARWLMAKGRNEEALAKAREASILEPNNSEASSLLNSLLPK